MHDIFFPFKLIINEKKNKTDIFFVCFFFERTKIINVIVIVKVTGKCKKRQKTKNLEMKVVHHSRQTR